MIRGFASGSTDRSQHATAALRRDEHRPEAHGVAVVLARAVVGEVRRREVELHVGRRQARAGAHERERLGDRRGQRPGLLEEPLEQVLGLLGVGERAAARQVPDAEQVRVVLEVLPDARKVDLQRHADVAQVPGRRRRPRASGSAASRMRPRRGRCPCGPGRPSSRRRGGSARPSRGRPRCPRAATWRAVHDLEVRALHRRAQVRLGGAEAPAVLLRHLDERGAVLLGAVVVVDARDAGRLRGGEEALRDRARRALVGDVQRAADGVVLGGAALVVLRLQEVRPTPSQPQPVAPCCSHRS